MTKSDLHWAYFIGGLVFGVALCILAQILVWALVNL